MELSRVERQRFGLVQFLVLLMLIASGATAYLGWASAGGAPIIGLAAVSLLTGLYVIARERALARAGRAVVAELVETVRKAALHEESLKEERERSSLLSLKLRELTDLYTAICSVNSVLHPEQAFVTVLRAAMDLVEGDCGSIMLVNPGERSLRIVCAHGLHPEVIGVTSQPFGKGIAGWVAQVGEPVLLTGDADADGRFRSVVRRAQDLNYAMSVPLSLRGEVMGVINLGSSSKGPRRFTEYHLRLATVFCQHAAVAIENARLRMPRPERHLAAV